MKKFYNENEFVQLAAAIIRILSCIFAAGYVFKTFVLHNLDYPNPGIIVTGLVITLLILLSVVWRRFEW
jgi:hypothetical protein